MKTPTKPPATSMTGTKPATPPPTGDPCANVAGELVTCVDDKNLFFCFNKTGYILDCDAYAKSQDPIFTAGACYETDTTADCLACFVADDNVSWCCADATKDAAGFCCSEKGDCVFDTN